MATDEEYLDSLLKTLEGNDTDASGETQAVADDDWKAGLDELLGFTDTKEMEQESDAGDDMLALLQSIKDDESSMNDESSVNDESIVTQTEESQDDFFNEEELLNLFAEAENRASEETQEQVAVEASEESEPEPVIKEPKKKKSRFSKKKKENAETEPEQKAFDSEAEKGKEKKVGFWGNLLQKLTEEVEEEEKIEDIFSDGNVELPGAEAAEGKKSKKESKKKKDKKGKKGKKEKENNDANAENPEEIAEGVEDKKKEKKKKKERKKKEKEEKPKEKSPKILSRKSMMVLIAFCATLIAAVVAISFFLNDYADKKKARDAFYIGDYEEAYVLLYDKNLNESDELIYQRIEAVLQLERTLDTYETYKKLNLNPEALDALLQGIRKYESMQMTDQYGAKEELAAVHQKIVETLEQDYKITLEEAKEINTYDDLTYTNVIYSIINGTEYAKPGEEEEKQPPQDILSEEEAIIQMDTENEGA